LSWGVHIHVVVNNALTGIKIRESMPYASVYCGAPAGMEETRTAEGELNEMAERSEGQRELK
jgi:4-carboxymuconolactone decarboxylase